MSALHPASNTRWDSTGLLGLRELAAALDLWRGDPTAASHQLLGEVFGRVVAEAGLGGGHLHIKAPPLAEVELLTEFRKFGLFVSSALLSPLTVGVPARAVNAGSPVGLAATG